MKIIAFDIDDVLCYRESTKEINGIEKYSFCIPIEDNIKIINECYESGYYIKLYTARGMTYFSGDTEEIKKNLFDLTTKQMKEFGIKYHELIIGKTHYDLFVDDKALNIKEVKNLDMIKKFLGD